MLPTVGLHHVSYDEYDAWPAERFSRLRLMLRSPLHYHANVPEESSTLDESSALHAAILEPDTFDAQFIVKPEGYDGRKSEWKSWKENEAAGRELLDADFPDMADAIRLCLALHPVVDAIMQADRKHTECSLHWIDKLTSEPMKVRLDMLSMYERQGCIVNFKFVRFAARHSFNMLRAKLHYHMQAAISLDGANAIAPANRRYVWIACEKSPPYGVATYEATEPMLMAGRSLYINCIKRVQACRKANHWPGYNDSIEMLDLFKFEEDSYGYDDHEESERSYTSDALAASLAVTADSD